jgi:hypothetical protein
VILKAIWRFGGLARGVLHVRSPGGELRRLGERRMGGQAMFWLWDCETGEIYVESSWQVCLDCWNAMQGYAVVAIMDGGK